MVVDNLVHLKDYLALHSDMEAVMRFLSSADLNSLPVGKIMLEGTECFVNVQTISPKTEAESRFEAHRKMIDIQIPLTGDEKMGYAPLSVLSQAPYDENKDLAFYKERPEEFVTVRKGMFAIFFPQDAHAPGVTPVDLKKVVIKLPITGMKKL